MWNKAGQWIVYETDAITWQKVSLDKIIGILKDIAQQRTSEGYTLLTARLGKLICKGDQELFIDGEVSVANEDN